MRHIIKGEEYFILVEKEIYGIEVLHKCFYWYGANYYVTISSFSDQEFEISLKPKSTSTTAQNIIEKIQQDLIDFKLRDIVTTETKAIRELIISKAFAYYDLDENPATQISDPVGFNPESIRDDG
jgi:His-Xaa-Ser system protein HxsD